MAPTRPRNAVERLPTEVIVTIFCSAESAGDVRALLLTSKMFHSAFLGSENHIAKAHIMRLLDPDDYKLGVMAAEAYRIHPLDKGAVEQFFKDYVHDDEWSLRLFRMRSAARLPRLTGAVSRLVRSGNMRFRIRHRDFDSETPTEHARKVRAFYIHDIAVNLFHSRPGSPGEMLLKEPDRRWSERYWANFSPGEIS